MKKLFIYSIFEGCVQLSYTLGKILIFFENNGYFRIFDPKKADYVIIGGCCAHEGYEKKSLNIIKYFLKQELKEKIIVCGCIAGYKKGYIEKNLGVKCISLSEMNKFDSLIKSKYSIKDTDSSLISTNLITNKATLNNDSFYIKISKGCSNNCAYCSIKKAKGKLESRTIDEINRDFQKGIKNGYKKFILLSDDLGSYGKDIGTDFISLLKELFKEKKEFRLHLINLEPSKLLYIFPQLKTFIATCRIVHIKVPLQSGSNRIINLMCRKYNVNDVISIIKKIKLIYPHIFIASEFIFGFPTESHQEFLESIRISRYFDKSEFFLYSERPRTRACSIKPKVSPRELKKRIEIIKKLERKIRKIKLQSPLSYHIRSHKISTNNSHH